MSEVFTLCLLGDLMLGRGIDQILPRPGDPELRERYVKSAKDYVALAEGASGAIPRPVGFDYVWGEALAAFEPAQIRIANLETSVTTSRDYAPKGINYKMNPLNVGCLSAAGIDCCVLANNHVLDFGEEGLTETLETLEKAGLRSAGAGRGREEAEAPAAIPVGARGRVLVFAFAATTSGVPRAWAAAEKRPGVALLPDISRKTAAAIAERLTMVRRAGDIAVASIHWGGNWGYEIGAEETSFAHALVERGGFDLVHGHSSHHPKAIEIWGGKPILYGCGDFLNDYEGIEGYEEFRGDLRAAYLPRFEQASGRLVDFPLIPFRIRRFRLERASREEAAWLSRTLDRESARFSTRVFLCEDTACRICAR